MAQTTVSYTSPIANFAPFADEKVSSWKAANDKVDQIGGWRAYAKEAQQPDNTPTPTPTSTSTHSPSALPSQKPGASSSDVMKTDPHAAHKQ